MKENVMDEDKEIFVGYCLMCGKSVYGHPNDIPTIVTEVFCSQECADKWAEATE
jgi:ribosome-binding protein aMBF1 (putative translation factor)